MSQGQSESDDNLPRNRQRYIHSYYTTTGSGESLPSGSVFDRRNPNRSLGRVRTVWESSPFFRRPKLGFVKYNLLDATNAVIGISVRNNGGSPLLNTAGRVSVELPLVKRGNAQFQSIIPNNRDTVDCEWTLADGTHAKKYDLYPDPDRLLLQFAHVSSITHIVVSLFDTLPTTVLTSNRDLVFGYTGERVVESRDFCAVFTLWVRGTTPENEYKHFERMFLVRIPNLGRLGQCDLSNASVSVHPWKDARSVSRELFRVLNQEVSSSAPPPTSSPSPQ